jgi:eukaryotic-like serine/threonine-protein kinase
MPVESPSVRSIFDRAVEIPSEADRQAFLDEACAAAPEIRREVEALLSAHADAGSFLDAAAVERPQAGLFEPSVEAPGATIGPYKLLEQIGEGGFGVVFLAEQSAPVKRKVALKVIKPGMDSRAVVARFEAERQALALMDHPNIAKIYDAGMTGSRVEGPGTRASNQGSPALDSRPSALDPPTGRPYFVMELVPGVPITDYCDQCQLSTRERLELFITVCHAVQHAHQKGVIHRDLKPTNVLVALQDGKAAPKIIDFGVAKALNQRLTEQTLATGFAQMIGTPLYMSPEQAELSPLGADTRSDVYSLGVLLYELLTGATPFGKDQLHSAGYDEMRRILREEEPPRPSARLSTLAADLATTIAEQRRTEPHRLAQQVHGELDWIVMKCLEKDRSRRYETANSLADDIRRHLHDEPVTAAAPSRLYRAGKFIRRNKFTVIAGSAVLTGLVAGVIGLAMGLVSQARQRAEAQLNLAIALQSQRKYADAETLFRKGLQSASSATAEDRQREATTRLRLAQVMYERGHPEESERLYRGALASFRNGFPSEDPAIAHAQTTFALLLRAQRRFDEAENLLREAYEIYRRATPADHRATGESATHLANVLITLRRYAEAEPIAREAIRQHQSAIPVDFLALALARVELGRDLIALGKFSEAESQLLDAERVLSTTDYFHTGILAPIALYTRWNEAEPGSGYDLKAQAWTRKLIGTFVRLDDSPLAAPEAQRAFEVKEQTSEVSDQ